MVCQPCVVELTIWLMIGILPNAKSDTGPPKKKKPDPNAYLTDLMFKEDEMD